MLGNSCVLIKLKSTKSKEGWVGDGGRGGGPYKEQ